MESIWKLKRGIFFSQGSKITSTWYFSPKHMNFMKPCGYMVRRGSLSQRSQRSPFSLLLYFNFIKIKRAVRMFESSPWRKRKKSFQVHHQIPSFEEAQPKSLSYMSLNLYTILFSFKFFYWSIVHSRCCVSLRCTAK